MANHLGNVLVTVSDKRLVQDNYHYTLVGLGSDYSYNADLDAYYYTPGAGVYAQTSGADGELDWYTPDVLSYSDYYAFGAPQTGRNGGDGYRYGFNGKESDDEVKGVKGSHQDYGMRMYDPRVGRFFSADPLMFAYAYMTPYQFASNCPITNIDIDGMEGGRANGALTFAGPLHSSSHEETSSITLPAEWQKEWQATQKMVNDAILNDMRASHHTTSTSATSSNSTPTETAQPINSTISPMEVSDTKLEGVGLKSSPSDNTASNSSPKYSSYEDALIAGYIGEMQYQHSLQVKAWEASNLRYEQNDYGYIIGSCRYYLNRCDDNANKYGYPIMKGVANCIPTVCVANLGHGFSDGHDIYGSEMNGWDYTWNAMGLLGFAGLKGAGTAGDLSGDVAKSFRFGNYTKLTLTEPIVLARYYDGVNAFAKGRYMTTPGTLTGIGFIDRMTLALRPSWNKMKNIAYWELPAGTTVYKGRAATQFPWIGGARQYFVPELSNLKQVIH